MLPNVVFFARDYQSKFFPKLKSERYRSVYVTLTRAEKCEIEAHGDKVEYCFEEMYHDLPVLDVDPSYLETSLQSDRFLSQLKLADRLNILSKEIAFWKKVFDDMKPIAVVNETVAIEISEVMHIEAKSRNIKYLAWICNPINGYFYFLTSPLSSSLDAEVFYETPSDKAIMLADEYINKRRIGLEKPFYVKGLMSRYDPRIFLRNFISYISLRLSKGLHFDHCKSILVHGAAEKFYYDNIVMYINSFLRGYDDLDKFRRKECVFYPLHYEPEATLLYMSEYFSDQCMAIENIAKCLKLNQVLVVKEHPQQPGILLTKRFRLLKRRVSNLVYAPGEMSSIDIIKRSELVVTLTSSAGWDAIILGKPVYVLGKVFYDKYPYVNVFESFQKLRSDIHDGSIVSPDYETTKRFMAQLVDYSHKGNPFPHTELYTDSNIDNIITAINSEIIYPSDYHHSN